jgi:hypothetical protein
MGVPQPVQTECYLAYLDLEYAEPPTVLVSPYFDAIVLVLRAVVPFRAL